VNQPLLSLPIREEYDVVSIRQRAKQIAELVGFDRMDQTRLATAVSEIARNAFMYAHGGRCDYFIEGRTAPQLFVLQISDAGPGIADLPAVLSGGYRSPTGLGVGIIGARRLVDRFDIVSTPSGTCVRLARIFPARAPFYGAKAIGELAQELTARRPVGPLEEVRYQNQELVRALEALRSRQEELERVNRELEDTNRGVVALYAELDERADHLRRADELKTKFLSNMTHEFRTPVNSILALGRLLAERLQVPEHEKNELFYIRKSAQQLSDLVDDLLDIAKVEAGKIEVRPGHFEVAALFGALRGMLRPLLVSPSLALVFEDTADLPPLYTDESKISQILRNFISNAIKYTEQGEVRVRATYRSGEGEMRFDVSDTGIGIPQDDLPRIFDEFVQIENPLQKRTKGTGLGLPLSRRLAELLGGRISVASELGVGSTFTLTVPLLYRDALVSVGVPEVEPGMAPVLVVEDSAEDIVIYQRMFAGTGFQLIHAQSADAARTIVDTVRPVAVILDIHVHGRDMWDLLVDFKRSAGTPVLVISTTDDRRKAMGLGADGFSLKPVDRDWLIQSLEAFSQRRRPVRVLVVDDEEAFRFVMRQSLSGDRYELREAATGTAALAAIAGWTPDVVLLDLDLPDVSGLDVAQRLAADVATARVRVVIVSSHSVPESGPQPAVAAVLPKGTLTPDDLRATIRDVIAAGSPVSRQ
jgi:signal transduction histidine kinase/CheY-like chemotaxis protein